MKKLKLTDRAFLHDHSPFEVECTTGCGWYAIGRQITSFDPLTKRTIVIDVEKGP